MQAEPVHAFTREGFMTAARERIGPGHGPASAIYRHWMREGRFSAEGYGLTERSVSAWHSLFHAELPVVRRVIDETQIGARGPMRTAKAIIGLSDGLEVECVSIPMGRGRSTLCVSSQVGCRMGCRFCETGRMGLLRQLRCDEIIAQVLVARHQLGWQIDNIVFMGMGEALDNREALLPALQILTDPGGLEFAQEKLTICTVGHVEGLRELAALGLRRLNLSVSLNAANDEQRAKLMPINRLWPLAELQAALIAYRPRRNFVLAVNYCLMPDLNDSRDDARAVAAFVAPLGRALVNVIPYNPGNAPLTRAPTDEESDRFIDWLREDGAAARRRVTKGRSVMAACGQLGNADLRRQRQTAAP